MWNLWRAEKSRTMSIFLWFYYQYVLLPPPRWTRNVQWSIIIIIIIIIFIVHNIIYGRCYPLWPAANLIMWRIVIWGTYTHRLLIYYIIFIQRGQYFVVRRVHYNNIIYTTFSIWFTFIFVRRHFDRFVYYVCVLLD